MSQNADRQIDAPANMVFPQATSFSVSTTFQGGINVFDNIVMFTGGISQGIINTVSNLIRIVNPAFTVVEFSIDTVNPAANDTVMTLNTNNAGSIANRRVSVGAADSGGVGFRALRVPN